MSDRVRVEVRGRHARLRFDDGRMNLLSHAGLDAISEALASLHYLLKGTTGTDLASRVTPVLVSLESGRPGLFAAGADMLEMRSFGAAGAEEFSRKGQDLFRRIARFPALTAVTIDGDCFGGALDFAMAFDVRVSTTRSRFSHPGGKIGIVTGFGGTARWRSSASPSAAGRLFLNNEILSADEAKDMGLVHQVENDMDELIERLQSSLDRLGHLPELKSLAARKRNLRSLVLHAKRLRTLCDVGSQDRRNGAHGHSRDTSRHIFR